jgi:predicted transcriptional regulator YdeE
MMEKKDDFKLVGLKLVGKTTNQNNQSGKDCGHLWQKFERDNILELIPNKLSIKVYAVNFNYEGDETNPFSYFIGCKVDMNSETPKELEYLIIPSQYYKRFTAKGAMTECITDTWKQIWNSRLNRKFGFDFEVYDERSKDWSNAEVDIYISTNEQI